MTGIARVLYPATLDEALGWLAEPGLRAAPLAGGTTLAAAPRPKIETLVDVTRLGLSAIRDEGGAVVVEANVRIQAVKESHALDRVAGGILRAAAARVGSRLIRNAATVGGNLVHVAPWSDLPVACLVLDGEVVLARRGGGRRVTIQDFLAQHPSRFLAPGELLTELRLPATGPGCGGAFHKFTRTEVDDALVSAAAFVALDPDGTCATARVAVGAARPLPQRSPAAEAALGGGPPTPERIDAAARAAATQVQPVKDARASRAYRAHLVEVVVGRVLREAVAAAQATRDGGSHV
jgi:carbon-monoxide dehydrogenase medium subunit